MKPVKKKSRAGRLRISRWNALTRARTRREEAKKERKRKRMPFPFDPRTVSEPAPTAKESMIDDPHHPAAMKV